LLVDASPASTTAPPEDQVVRETLSVRHEVFRTVELDDHEDYRIVATPIERDGDVVGVLVTGIEWSRVDEPLQTLRIILIVAVSLTGAALAGGAYLIARHALQPVAQIVMIARRITRGDLLQRIAASPARDEIGELTSTLNAMIARLAETVERERRFTADASHELRTPLAAIEAAIDVTLTQPRPVAEYERVLQMVRTQTQGLHRLAQQLLLLSRLDAQELRAGFELLDLGEVIGVVVESFVETYPTAHVHLSTPNEIITVRGDVELLARALINILENAVAHVGHDVVLTIDVQTTLAQTAVMTITDNGPGISSELAAAVFQRFRRGSASRSGDGTGLGLAIVESILSAHDGTAQLLSRPPGEGAGFVLTLPLVAGSPPAPAR
jgi:signal transduction histidine kinase